MAEETTETLAETTSAGRVEEFYWDTVVFKVENSLFKVPRDQFIAQSEVFAGMFLVPRPVGDEQSAEGGSDSNPIVLEGYKADDFKALLKVLYPSSSMVTQREDLTKSELASVLRLSTIWGMNKIRSHAIKQLSIESLAEAVLSPTEKITLAREHRISKWFFQGVTSLVKDNLSLDDLETSVGIRTAYRILGIKLECNSCSQCRRGGSHTIILGSPMKKLIRDAFEDEINEIVKDERQYGVEEDADDGEDNCKFGGIEW
ncbi:hypothetical protein D9611_006149 [Ephemerocybe angulata]|uniref:BTB domain-containing protein n=1 Tax=Ephemerocybe angulata TaxID=980116 RepID=A0A8H5CH91_9AGAR|nr:hypothetical protein D9611_006149 [Tulosesus angulatus]